MPSTYSIGSKLELMAAGENSGNWGGITNNNLKILDSISFGFVQIQPTGTGSTLTTSDGGLSGSNPEDANHKVLVYAGTSANHTVTISPNTVQKTYYVHNTTAYNLTFRQGDGTGGTVTIAPSHAAVIYSTGTGVTNTAAVKEVSSSMQFSDINVTGGNISGLADPIEIADGGTGGTTVSEAQTGLGLLIGTNTQAWDAKLDQISSTGTPTNNHFLAVQEDSGNPGTYTWQSVTPTDARAAMGVNIGSEVQGYDDGLESIAGLTTAADKMIYTTGSDVYAVTDFSAVGRSFVGAADANAAVTVLEPSFTDATKLGLLQITTNGTAETDTVVSTDSNGDASGIRVLSAKGFNETTYDNGTTATFDLDNGSVFKWAPNSATVSVVFSNTPPASSTVTRSWTIVCTPNQANPQISWPSNVEWSNGYPPANPFSGTTSIFSFMQVCDGTVAKLYGFMSGDRMS